jgi:hypothetical protein
MDRSRESAGRPKSDFQAVEDMNCKIDMILVSRLACHKVKKEGT